MDRTLAALAVVVIGGLAVALWRGGDERTPTAVSDDSPVSDALRGDAAQDEGYARVTGPRPFEFPADHGAHPDYRNEWWYFTGNLATSEGRAFGFQLTFFRFALAAAMPVRQSDWATRQAWMAHFAVTDVRGGEHRAFERFQRGAVGLAGARLQPVRIWLDDWRVEAQGEGLFPLRLTAHENGMALDLTLRQEKPVVLQGEQGYSRKSAQPGNASYYYSYTRLQARGTVTVAGEAYSVSGGAWLDREWSTSALAADQVGWDWFALQLDDGRDLMVYRLRRRDGTTDPASAGVLVAPDGSVRRLSAGEFTLSPQSYWQSPAEGTRYPVDWRLQLPAADLDLAIEAQLDNQEMDLQYRYWEGAVRVSARSNDSTVRGRGYLEMTGYGVD